MKKNAIESLNTSVSNSSHTSYFLRTPTNSRELPSKNKIVKSPSTTLTISDKEGLQLETNELLRLQLEQLKRENQFLKKKLEETMHGQQNDHMKTKILMEKQKDDIYKKLGSLPLTTNFFFEQIGALVESMTKVFKTNFSQKEMRIFEQEKELCPIKRYVILKDFELKRSLQKIMLEDEPKRFQRLVDLFAHYYKAKQQSEKAMIEKIDKMTIRLNQLNKVLVLKSMDSKKHRNISLSESITFGGLQKDFSKPMVSPLSKTQQRNRQNVMSHIDNQAKFFRRTNKAGQETM